MSQQEQLPILLRQNPASITSRTPCLFLKCIKKLDVFSCCLLRLGYTKGNSQRVPKPIPESLPHQKAASLLLLYPVEQITFFFPSKDPLGPFLAKLMYFRSLDIRRDALSNMCVAAMTSPWKPLACTAQNAAQCIPCSIQSLKFNRFIFWSLLSYFD